MDNNRYEDVPEKENGFKKALKAVGTYFKNVFGGFIDSFRYNNMKLAAILVALPGLIIGFFLIAHARAINEMSFKFVDFNTDYMKFYEYNIPQMPFDGTAISVFLIMLFGILNVFNALSMSNKKNLGSVVIATVFTGIMLVLSAYYVYAAILYNTFSTDGVYVAEAVNNDGYVDVIDRVIVNQSDTFDRFTANYLVSLISILVSDALSIGGVVLGFINYDRTYEKVDR